MPDIIAFLLGVCIGFITLQELDFGGELDNFNEGRVDIVTSEAVVTSLEQEKGDFQLEDHIERRERKETVIHSVRRTLLPKVFHGIGLPEQQIGIRDQENSRTQQFHIHSGTDKVREPVVFHRLWGVGMFSAVEEDV